MNKINYNILLVEDDPNLGVLLKDFLSLKNYSVELIADGKVAFERLTKSPFDLCIFDVMLPSMDGFTLAKSFRKFDSNTPIIFLTAKSLQQDKIEGLKAGADDYIVKPFNTEELLLRINAVIRRTVSNSNLTENISICGFEYNYPLQSLKFRDIHYKLSTKENELLCLLLQNKNCVVERNFVLNKIWNNDSYFASRSMDVYISKLRSYFKDTSSVEIVNVHGKGFKFLVKE